MYIKTVQYNHVLRNGAFMFNLTSGGFMTDSEKLKIALILLSKANRVRYEEIIKLMEEQAKRK